MGALYKSLPGFLGGEIRNQLLEYVLANESRFESSTVGDKQDWRRDESIRISRRLGDLGDFRSIIEQQVLARLPEMIAALGVTTFQPSGFETEITAYGDGSLYRRHVDTYMGTERPTEDRLLSLVYYFYCEPRSFTGGVLRLYPVSVAVGGGAVNAVDIRAEQDTAVVFSSWVPHEVLRVACPSGKFADSRFAINCWILRARNLPGPLLVGEGEN